MAPRLEWAGLGPYWAVAVVAVALTAWQVRADRAVFTPYLGGLHPTVVMVALVLVGATALASLRATSTFTLVGPGSSRDALAVVVCVVPLLAASAIAADLLLRFDEDMNVAMPDAVRFYPAIAMFVEIALHLVPIAVLVGLLGAPTAIDLTFWRIAIPVALVEAVLQAVYATSLGTSVFAVAQLLVFGVVQVWVFWRFGFVWMLGFRLAYYAAWHVAWGVVRLELLF